MKYNRRLTATAIALAVGAGIVSAPLTAHASEEGRRNTALGLGAAAAALLLTQHNKVPGIVVGAGALYAYSRYDGAIRDRHRDYNYDYERRRDRYREDYREYRHDDYHRDRDRHEDRYDGDRRDRDRHEDRYDDYRRDRERHDYR